MKRSPFQDQTPSLCLAPDRSAVAHVRVRAHLAPRCSAFCGPGRLRRGRGSWQSSIRAAALLGLEPAFCSFLALDKVLDILGWERSPRGTPCKVAQSCRTCFSSGSLGPTKPPLDSEFTKSQHGWLQHTLEPTENPSLTTSFFDSILCSVILSLGPHSLLPQNTFTFSLCQSNSYQVILKSAFNHKIGMWS